MNGVSSSTLPPWATRLLVVLAVILVLAPLPVTIWNEFGDADAAWDGIVAVLWAQQGHLPTQTGVFVEERFRSSPLSIWLLKEAVRTGRLEPSEVARATNIITAGAGLLLPLLAWRLLRRLRGTDEALVVLLLLLTSPVFFRLRCYGLPTLPACALFVGGLLCFDHAAVRPQAWWWLLASAASLALAVLTKVDVVLLAPAFVGLAWFRKARPSVAWAAWLIPVAAVVAWHLFCRVIAPAAPETGQTLANWSSKWRLVPAGLIDRTNLLNMAMAPGFGTLALAIVAAAWAVTRRQIGLAMAVAACVLPTILFWGMREMNSSRHNFWLVLPLALFAAAGLIGWLRVRPGAVLVALLASLGCNYLVGPWQEDFRLAPANFHVAAIRRARQVRSFDERYEAMFADAAHRRICVHSMREETAHALAVWLQRFDHSEVRVTGKGQNDWKVRSSEDGAESRLWMPDQDQPLNPAALAADGWTVRRGG